MADQVTVGYRIKVNPLGIVTLDDFYRYCNAYGIRILSMQKTGGLIGKAYHAVIQGHSADIRRMRRQTDYWFS